MSTTNGSDELTYDDVRAVGDALPPSHVPSAAELNRMVGALAAILCHGAEIVAASIHGTFDNIKNVSDVDTILSPDSPARDTPASVQPLPTATQQPTGADVAELSRKVDQLVTAMAQSAVSPQPGVTPVSASPPEADTAAGGAGDGSAEVISQQEREIEQLRTQLAAAEGVANRTAVTVSPDTVPATQDPAKDTADTSAPGSDIKQAGPVGPPEPPLPPAPLPPTEGPSVTENKPEDDTP